MKLRAQASGSTRPRLRLAVAAEKLQPSRLCPIVPGEAAPYPSCLGSNAALLEATIPSPAEANLIRKVQPEYPPLAKSARVRGSVEFTAIIDKEGNVESLTLVRGHPLLVNAAREAVQQWKYKPTLLGGERVEVITEIIVNFALSQ